MFAKDMEKDRSWVIIKAVGYLHLSHFLTFQLTECKSLGTCCVKHKYGPSTRFL